MNNNGGHKNNTGSNKAKKPSDNKRGVKAWEDDEKQNDTKPTAPMPKPAEHSVKEARLPHKEQPSSIKPPSYEPKPPTYDYEIKIIDDILEVSGISSKPTEGQLGEFIKRIRTLNKDVIWQLINGRLAKYVTKGNGSEVKSLTNMLYVIERILKDNVSGYQEIIKPSAQIYQEVFNRNYNKKANLVSSSIYHILTGQMLLIQEDNMANGKQDYNINITQETNLLAPKMTVNHTVDNNKGKPEPSKFQFIKKKQPADSSEIINNNIIDINQPPMNLFENIQPSSTPEISEAKKPRLFNFIGKNKASSAFNTNGNQQEPNKESDIFSQLKDLNFDQPIAHPVVQQRVNEDDQNKEAEKKPGLDLELFAKCYSESTNNNANSNQNQYTPNMAYPNHSQGPVPIGMNPYPGQYPNGLPMTTPPPNHFPNDPHYPYQPYNMPYSNMYNMPPPNYPINPNYQPQYYPGSNYTQPPLYPNNNYPQQAPFPKTNGNSTETKAHKPNQSDPFGNLLDLMKSK